MPYSNIPQENHPTFSCFFSDLKEPRRTIKGNHKYPLNEILFMTISAVISGMDTWTMISKFGQMKIDWLRKFFPYEKGTPSHDVLGRVFAALDPESFSSCFISWVDSLAELTKGEVVSIDGKTICRSDDKNTGKSALHVVSAFAAENRLCLGQKAVDAKSNEITAIPALLELIAIKGCIVTIDAMGCQKTIAEDIVKKEADYVLMVKGNQGDLKQQVEKIFSISAVTDEASTSDLGHGRIEHRKCEVIDKLDFLDDKEEWFGLKSVARITSERICKQTGRESKETRYFITSLPADAKKIGKAIRSHWAVENSLHWSLDVVFKEDDLLKKKGNSALNYNIIAKMALTLIDKERSTKDSKPVKRMAAALDDNYRAKLLKV